MKKLLGLFAFLVLVFPSVSFAATDSDIRASLVQQLLTLFVQEVNGIQAMQETIGQSSNPAQFNDLSKLLKSQFSDTEGQLAALLNPPAVEQGVSSVNVDSIAIVDNQSAEVATPTFNTPRIVFGKNKLGEYIDITADTPISTTTIQKKDGTILQSLMPVLNNMYSDGNYHYIGDLDISLQPSTTSTTTLFFRTIITAVNGAIYTTPLWQSEPGQTNQPTVCVFDSCAHN